MIIKSHSKIQSYIGETFLLMAGTDPPYWSGPVSSFPDPPCKLSGQNIGLHRKSPVLICLDVGRITQILSGIWIAIRVASAYTADDTT